MNIAQVIQTFHADKIGQNKWKGVCPVCAGHHLIIEPGKKQAVTAFCADGCDQQRLNALIYKEAKSEPFDTARFCAMKKLPKQWATPFCGVVDAHFIKKDGTASTELSVCFPYIGEDGSCGGVKHRFSESSHDAAWSLKPPYRPMLYGLWLWPIYREYDIPTDIVVLVEGESDTLTLAFNGIPALGVSGAKAWKKEFAKYAALVDAKRIFVVHELDSEEKPSTEGAALVQKVAESFPAGKVWELILPVKDPSELWIKSKTSDGYSSDDFEVAWLKAETEAKPATEQAATSDYRLTDSGNAELLVTLHGANFRWLTDVEQFYVWNNTVWRPNKSGDILLPQTKDVARQINDPKWQQASESAGKRRAMIAMTKGEQSVWSVSNVFDRKPWLLNVANGTLDLQTGNLRDFDRQDYISKQSPITYDPFAACPKFDAFLDYIFRSDKDTIHFMLKALGYTLTGTVGESCFFICYGLGANGKTTLIETLMQLLGADFARPAKFSTFVASKSSFDSKYELATFKGARLITAIEPRKAGHLDEEVLKQITGGDQIMARDIYKENVVYYPEFKLWLAMNNQPRIIGTDEGIWRRVRMIPFTVQISDSMKVKEFHKVLFSEEGSGILNRLIEGCRAWQEEGLKMPSPIEKATTEFRAAQNVIQGFFDSCTLSGKPNQHAKTEALYAAYKRWAEEQGEFVIRTNEFAEELDRRGFVRRRVRDDGVHRFAITLKASPTEDDAKLNFDD